MSFNSKNKKKFILGLISICLLAIFLVIYNIFLMGGGKIHFSHKSGFYDKEFYLKITANPKYTIRYTLDGSTPNLNSPIYKSPLLIKDISEINNIYSNVINIPDEIEKTFEFGIPPQLLFFNKNNSNNKFLKGTLLNVAIFDNNKLLNKKSQLYFINFDNNKKLYVSNIVSITIDPNFLLKLYSPPKIKYFTSFNKFLPVALNDIVFAEITFFKNKKVILTDKCKIKLSGSMSKYFPQRTFTIILNNKQIALEHSCNKFLLYSCSTDHIKINDYIIYTLNQKNNSYKNYRKMVPTALFINGEFWGAYYITEKINKKFFSNQFNIKSKNLIYKKGGYNNNIINKININTIINYLANNLYINNSDIYPNNIFFLRLNNKEWKMFGYDYNSYNMFDRNSIINKKHSITKLYLFKKIIKDETLYNKLKEHIIFLQNEVYTEKDIDIILNNYEKYFMPLVNLSNHKYYGENLQVTKKDLDDIREFFKDRGTRLIKELDKIHNETKTRE